MTQIAADTKVPEFVDVNWGQGKFSRLAASQGRAGLRAWGKTESSYGHSLLQSPP